MGQDNLVVGKHYPALDGLRGLAVLMVIFFHSSNFSYEMTGGDLSDFTQSYYVISLLGQTGVDLFFVLSGFLITGILMDTAEDNHKFKRFYIRRSLRIFPLYYMVLLVLVITLPSTLSGENVLKTLTYFFYIQNWSLQHSFDGFMYLNHIWSLAVEEQFYIIWPFVFWSFYNKSIRGIIFIIAVMVLVSWLSRFYLSYIGEYKLAFTATICRIDSLAMGALISIGLKHYRHIMDEYMYVLKYIMAISLISLLLLVLSQEQILNAHKVIISLGLVFCSIFYAALLANILLLGKNCLVSRVLENKAIKQIGRISYGLYIIHMPIVMIMAQFLYDHKFTYWSGHICLFLCGFILSYILASLSYRYFEKPILKLKNKYAPMRQAI